MNDNHLALYNEAVELFSKMKLKKAKKKYLKLLNENHNFYAMFDLSLILLLEENFLEGFKLYESRRFFDKFPKTFYVKMPDTINSMLNKRILIFHEQGFGDSIHFIRFINLFEQYNTYAELTILLQPSLIKLFEQTFTQVKFISSIDQLENYYDYVIPLLSLPFIFGITKTDSRQYLQINTKYIEEYRQDNHISSNNLNIGICWQGNTDNSRDCFRSISTHIIENFILNHPNKQANFFSLQKDCNQTPKNMLNFIDNCNDFFDTALLTCNMDIVISVDTSIIHLAGALGIKSYLLTPFVPDWRWGIKRKKSIIYDSVRLFRQKQNDAWESVLKKIIKKA